MEGFTKPGVGCLPEAVAHYCYYFGHVQPEDIYASNFYRVALQ